MSKLIFKLFLSIFLLLFFFPKSAFAIEDPLKSPNNIFGIHILSDTELREAANLVNSSGGDWGYITLVIQKGERNTERWQRVFDEARRLHLIPIVRVATQQLGGGWEKPSFDEIDGWVSFLNSLNWVIKNRYVVIGNEPNHEKEWGGEINPSEYARYSRVFSEKLKANSKDFFVLPAGFDFSAKNTKDTMDASVFLQEVLKEDPEYFNFIDGWTSHSYPNPGFVGSEKDKGRGTIASFNWELDFLKFLGLSKDLPVFITETGWEHETLEEPDRGIPSSELAGMLTYAYQAVWSDPKVVAVTPFVLNYQDPPFDSFSWKKKDGTFYEFYDRLKEVHKIKGSPERIASSQILASFAPFILGKNADFYGGLLVRNTGQTILNEEKIALVDDLNGVIEVESLEFLPRIEPFHSSILIYKAKGPKESGVYMANLVLKEEKTEVSNKKAFKIFTFGLKGISSILKAIF